MNHQSLSLPYLRLMLGVGALVLSLYFSIAFLSQGATGTAFIAALAFCIITEIVKALFAGDVMFYSAIKQNDKALFALAVVGILFCLSVIAAVWFLLANPLKEDVTLNNSTHRTEQLKQQIEAKQTALSTCNPNYLTKCVTPRTNELTALQTEYDKALNSESKLSDIAATQKFWQQTADFTGTSPENLKMGLALLRSVLLELLGIVLIGQFSSTKRLQNLHIDHDNALSKPTLATNDNSALMAEIADLKLQLSTHPKTLTH